MRSFLLQEFSDVVSFIAAWRDKPEAKEGAVRE